MADCKIKIDVSIAEMKVPLLIVVDDNNRTHIFKNGIECKNITRVTFTANVNELPLITTTELAVK